MIGFRRALVLLSLLVLASTSCAYYNTFYLARRYYDRATEGEPYAVDKAGAASAQNYTKAIDYSKKVLSNYPRSKWVDDAYLLWARGMLGRSDPLETVNLLSDFDSRFPRSPLKPQARFYLGVAYRQARKYREAEETLDDFLKSAPKDELAPYAYLERARALASLERWADAAEAGSRLLDKWPKGKLAPRARAARADALFAQGEYGRAREDFKVMGASATNDDERLNDLLREADCLEAARQYEAELALLKNALGHEVEPVVEAVPITPGAPGTATGGFTITTTTEGVTSGGPTDRYGRILNRIGTAQLQSGHQTEALEAYARVLRDYPRTPLAAEAQYRVGYTYETSADDFERARSEYARVKDQFSMSAFTTQASQRLGNLDRVAQFRTATGDTTEKRAEAGFLTAELYLFQNDKPERALEEYQKVARTFPGTPYEAKAMNAEAWVLSRKLKRKAEADSIFWEVVRHHPATEAQLAARDYLEAEGQTVPPELIKLPVPKIAVVDTSVHLTPPPSETPALGRTLPLGAAYGDSLKLLGPPAARDSLGRLLGTSPRDSLGHLLPPIMMRRDTTHYMKP
jgi:TolA-binding protein